ncbi:hypothetical protein [Streptomyces leeuwenhoekii]|uniref:hypothetical protein n=1 Tax=Streptomyces leeuwenhoekii TaxID=1437453 RepID=UPI000A58D2B8
MGTPSTTKPWGFQYEGHHLAVSPRAQPGRAHRVRRPVPAGLRHHVLRRGRRERPERRSERRSGWRRHGWSERDPDPAARPHRHPYPNGGGYGVDLLRPHLENGH